MPIASCRLWRHPPICVKGHHRRGPTMPTTAGADHWAPRDPRGRTRSASRGLRAPPARLIVGKGPTRTSSPYGIDGHKPALGDAAATPPRSGADHRRLDVGTLRRGRRRASRPRGHLGTDTGARSLRVALRSACAAHRGGFRADARHSVPLTGVGSARALVVRRRRAPSPAHGGRTAPCSWRCCRTGRWRRPRSVAPAGLRVRPAGGAPLRTTRSRTWPAGP